MAKGQATFAKRQKEIARKKHQADKAERKAERKLAERKGGLEDMMAYVDEFGRITDKTPAEQLAIKAAAERKEAEEKRQAIKESREKEREKE